MKAAKKITKGTILRNREIAPGIFTMDIKSRWMGKKSRAGQFVNIKAADDTTDPLLRIPLGIHKIRGEEISLLYKVVGAGTKLLSLRSPGGSLDMLGPLGKGFDVSPVIRRKKAVAVLIAGGHGIAPLFALAEELTNKMRKVEFFIGACTREEITCVEELKKIGAGVRVSTDDGSRGERGRVTEMVMEYLSGDGKDAEHGTIYACGPMPMIRAVQDVSKATGIPAQVTRDEYMACGIGACRGCAVETTEGVKLACTDGPVFNAAILKWDKETVEK
ncbi:MAG: dihydroorotate dehydrogenase electron transfer subunit [Candidatus Omnitrophica bacterium]|nr:dihydroorotate dehydrogenase electron transfer subunit [Candidatus Omnitrophota bacterium]MBU1851003.1 dihydroorotate dehydrogenase electron transfer subunit [Candidatus Omnitrophota bacterium]